MKKNIKLGFVTMSCMLLLFTGCGSRNPGTVEPPDAAPSGTEQREAGNADTGHITVAQVKAAVLENAGLAEEEVRFVRIHMDSENGVSEYDVEFICQDGEYDYKVSAVTGEILSMDCEPGSYDIGSLPSDAAQSPDIPQDPALPLDAAQSQMLPPDTSQGAGSPSQAQGQYIGKEEAKRIALEHAGLNAEEVRFAHAQLEADHGNWEYDVEFYKDNTEYDYDIDAVTGEILSFDRDAEYDLPGAGSSIESVQITEDQAKQIALEYAGVNEEDAQKLKIELDYDHGRGKYEVEWHVGQTEYSCDVDADTGSVLGFEKELY